MRHNSKKFFGAQSPVVSFKQSRQVCTMQGKLQFFWLPAKKTKYTDMTLALFLDGDFFKSFIQSLCYATMEARLEILILRIHVSTTICTIYKLLPLISDFSPDFPELCSHFCQLLAKLKSL